MPRLSHRETLLHEGLRIVHERGFAGASVRDIVHAADVPQGSFTNHFASKEVFALEIIDLYLKSSRDVIRDTLHDLTRTPLARLAAYVDLNIARRSKNGVRHGCLLGNFAAEASEHSEAICGNFRGDAGGDRKLSARCRRGRRACSANRLSRTGRLYCFVVTGGDAAWQGSTQRRTRAALQETALLDRSHPSSVGVPARRLEGNFDYLTIDEPAKSAAFVRRFLRLGCAGTDADRLFGMANKFIGFRPD
jgi:AcrR family transcriptional regulator